MRIGVIGASGQLGSELCQQLGNAAVPWTRAAIDLTDHVALAPMLRDSGVDLVINTAAYNKVDLAEDEPELAFAVNAFGPRQLALACAELELPLMHVSTDYVFGQEVHRDRPWQETDAPGPVSAYGTSKLTGEYFVRSLCPQHYVVRTCGLYGHAARQGAGKGNFVETMLRLGREREELRIVNDQHCTPTSVRDLAAALIELAATEQFGLYHATNSGQTTWAELAAEVFSLEQMNTRVIPIPSAEYPTKARRPRYSVLSCTRLEEVLGRPLPSWQEALRRYLEERRTPENPSARSAT